MAHSEGKQSALDPLKCSKTFKSYGPKTGHVSSQINILRIRRIREVLEKLVLAQLGAMQVDVFEGN